MIVLRRDGAPPPGAAGGMAPAAMREIRHTMKMSSQNLTPAPVGMLSWILLDSHFQYKCIGSNWRS
jgi:hypothetical protein